MAIVKGKIYTLKPAPHSRTFQIEAASCDTFLGQYKGTKGYLWVPVNVRVDLVVMDYLNMSQVETKVFKYDAQGDFLDSFYVIVERDEFLKMIDS